MQFSKNRSVHKETGRHGTSSSLDRLSPSTSQCRVVTMLELLLEWKAKDQGLATTLTSQTSN